MKKNVTVGERTFHIDCANSDKKWKAVVVMQPPTNNQLYTLPAPWSCEADTEEELNRKIDQYFEKMRK